MPHPQPDQSPYSRVPHPPTACPPTALRDLKRVVADLTGAHVLPLSMTSDEVRELRRCGTLEVTRPCRQASDEVMGLASDVQPDGSGRGWVVWWGGKVGPAETARAFPGTTPANSGQRCPLGRRGDLLWVRERYTTGDGMNETGDPQAPTYLADWPDSHYAVRYQRASAMPFAFSRLLLRCDHVRVERCKDAWLWRAELRLMPVSPKDAASLLVKTRRSPAWEVLQAVVGGGL